MSLVLVKKWQMWDKKGRKANNVYINKQNNVMSNYDSVLLGTLSLLFRTNLRIVLLKMAKLSYLHIDFQPSLTKGCPTLSPPCTKSPALLSCQAGTWAEAARSAPEKVPRQQSRGWKWSVCLTTDHTDVALAQGDVGCTSAAAATQKTPGYFLPLWTSEINQLSWRRNMSYMVFCYLHPMENL